MLLAATLLFQGSQPGARSKGRAVLSGTGLPEGCTSGASGAHLRFLAEEGPPKGPLPGLRSIEVPALVQRAPGDGVPGCPGGGAARSASAPGRKTGGRASCVARALLSCKIAGTAHCANLCTEGAAWPPAAPWGHQHSLRGSRQRLATRSHGVAGTSAQQRSKRRARLWADNRPGPGGGAAQPAPGARRRWRRRRARSRARGR